MRALDIAPHLMSLRLLSSDVAHFPTQNPVQSWLEVKRGAGARAGVGREMERRREIKVNRDRDRDRDTE